MLIEVLHQEKGYGSKKLLAEFPNKAFELMIPTGGVHVLETCVFSVSKCSKKINKISQHRKRSSLKFYTQRLNEC